MTTNENETSSPSKSRRLWIGAGVAALLAVVGVGVFVWWYLDDDSPDEVSIESASEQVGSSSATSAPGDESTPATEPTDDTTASDDTAGTGRDYGDDYSDDAAGTAGSTTTAADPDGETEDGDEGGAATGDLAGTWTVDTSIGEFSYEDSTGTFVGFRIDEELSGIGDTEAVGRTPAVEGSLTVDGTTISEVSIEADMTQITTNDSRRDNNVQSALDTDQFPTATFELTEPIDVGDEGLDGETVEVDAVGDLTIHGVTQSVTFPLEAQLRDDTIVVVGSLDITFEDYDVAVPSAPIVLSVDDSGPIELQLFFTR